MKITELMEKKVYTCKPEDTLEEAAGTMLKEDVGALPVVDSDNKLLGMITDRDICMSSLIEGRSLKDLPVSLAASSPVWTCKGEDPLGKAHTTMQTHKIHRIPVVDEKDKLLGIVGLGDIVRAAAKPKGGVTPTDLTQTLIAIKEPRKHAVTAKTVTPVKAKSPVKAGATR